MAGNNVLHFSDEGFDGDVLKSDVPVLVDFSATWCGPCRALAPVVEQLADEYAGRAKIGKLDVDECPDTAAKYQVRGVPTVLIFKNGNVAGQSVGLVSKSRLAEMLDKALT